MKALISNKYAQGRQGFTLIELIIVIAVIALLAAIISPAVMRALNRAHVSKCASNLRQIGLAITSYQTDHDGEYPLADRADFRPSTTNSAMHLLTPYFPAKMLELNNGQSWLKVDHTCPLYFKANRSYDPDGHGFGAYAYQHDFMARLQNNAWIQHYGGRRLAGRLTSELLGDPSAGTYSVSHWKPAQYGMVWDNGWTGDTVNETPHDYYGIPGHHPDYNVLFADLHVGSHQWVHRAGVIPPDLSRSVPPEFRDDQYRIE